MLGIMKKEQIYEYLKRTIKVLIYIEEHIDQDMTLRDLAKIACYSPFHFHRIFQIVVGETVYQYIKRLRLERSAGMLLYTERPVTEIALDAHFDTPSSFTKAFKKGLGHAPKNYRTLGQTIEETLKEIPMIKPSKIENTKDLSVLFIRRYGNYNKSPWEAWMAMSQFLGPYNMDKKQIRCFGVLHDDSRITEETKVRYDACVFIPQKVEAKGEVGKETIKGGKYAVFIHHGSYEELEQVFVSIYMKWLPKSKESYDNTRPPFCEHLHMEYIKTDPKKLVTKIYIPLL